MPKTSTPTPALLNSVDLRGRPITPNVLSAANEIAPKALLCVTGGPSNVTQTWHVGSYTINQSIAIHCEKTLVNGQ